MRYYVVADVHGFFKEMVTALRDKGFFEDMGSRKLILCGDMLDRGEEPLQMQEFMLDLLHKDELIFIRGNHEDLMIRMIEKFDSYKWNIALGVSHHNSNGTWDTALKLSGMDERSALRNTEEFIYKVTASDFYRELIPASVNYYETEHYVFVHGWIPCTTNEMPSSYRDDRQYKYNPKWRTAREKDWENARWYNGMKLAELYNVVESGKQIVCGHWNASFGHSTFEHKGDEHGSDADYSPYYGKGVIAIDACTALSGFVNCIVIDE